MVLARGKMIKNNHFRASFFIPVVPRSKRILRGGEGVRAHGSSKGYCMSFPAQR